MEWDPANAAAGHFFFLVGWLAISDLFRTLQCPPLVQQADRGPYTWTSSDKGVDGPLQRIRDEAWSSYGILFKLEMPFCSLWNASMTQRFCHPRPLLMSQSTIQDLSKLLGYACHKDPFSTTSGRSASQASLADQ